MLVLAFKRQYVVHNMSKCSLLSYFPVRANDYTAKIFKAQAQLFSSGLCCQT